MDSLAVALLAFLASAVVVIVAGMNLARLGDAISDITGWGRAFVGTVLIGSATSLPELVTNVSANILGLPGLVLGNIFGANLLNVAIISAVALVAGVRNVYGGGQRDTLMLFSLALTLAVIALAFSITGDTALAHGSLGGAVLIVAYLAGTFLVYRFRTTTVHISGEPPATERHAGKVYGQFALAALVIIVSAPVLTISVDAIADATGIARSFLGVLAVSIVTTMPETSVTVVAVLRGSYRLALGNLFGTNAFNLAILFFIDLASADALLDAAGPEHLVVAGSGVALMVTSLLTLISSRLPALRWARVLPVASVAAYPVLMFWVFRLSQQ
ncbi:MAG: hypothetical protein FJ318_04660 [SAR202 cluster bacterium]|nr:hypothetical protein [SAR202 cluster bacterium]